MARKMTIRKLALALVSIGALTVAGSIGGVAQAKTVRCSPPRGPGDDLVHSGHIRANNVTCQTTRKVMLACDRFSYGHSGNCRAVGFRWRCTSKPIGGLAHKHTHTETCTHTLTGGARSIAWIWLD